MSQPSIGQSMFAVRPFGRQPPSLSVRVERLAGNGLRRRFHFSGAAMIQPAIKRVIGFVDPSSTVPVSDAAAALEERLIADLGGSAAARIAVRRSIMAAWSSCDRNTSFLIDRS